MHARRTADRRALSKNHFTDLQRAESINAGAEPKRKGGPTTVKTFTARGPGRQAHQEFTTLPTFHDRDRSLQGVCGSAT